MTKYSKLTLGIAFVFVSLHSAIAQTTNTSACCKQKQPQVKAGAYYFDGWQLRTDRLKTEFTEREPLWGWNDGTQEIMDQQIDLAADNGLSFWAFDWYWPEEEVWRSWSGLTYETHPLNSALHFYLKSQKRHRLDFCLLVANHKPFEIFPKDWGEACSVWINLFQEKGYLSVDGKPLLIIYNPDGLMKNFGSPEEMKKAIDKLQTQATQAGLAGVWIAACDHTGRYAASYAKAGFNCTTGYNYRGAAGSALNLKRGDSSTFEQLSKAHEGIWQKQIDLNTPVPYIPLVTLGWDNRPRNPEKNMKSPFYWFTQPTSEQITEHTRNGIRWLVDHPKKTFKDRILLIYSWNEAAEGAYLTPTKAHGDAHLKALQKGLISP